MDGISVVSTALAMQALWCAVKTTETKFKLARKVAMYSIHTVLTIFFTSKKDTLNCAMLCGESRVENTHINLQM